MAFITHALRRLAFKRLVQLTAPTIRSFQSTDRRMCEHLNSSFYSKDGHIGYTVQHSLRLHPLQEKLLNKTLAESPIALYLGAPEVHQMCSNLIQLISGKRCLDVGMFTGASSLAWALAVPDDGEVHTMDVTDSEYKRCGEAIISSDPSIKRKIHMHLAPAVQTLDTFLADGQAERFDFAFIDADKENYMAYYEKCLKLVRSGGVIAIDNALGYGNLGIITDDEIARSTDMAAIHALNKHVHGDTRVNCTFLTTGDGLMLAFKR